MSLFKCTYTHRLVNINEKLQLAQVHVGKYIIRIPKCKILSIPLDEN